MDEVGQDEISRRTDRRASSSYLLPEWRVTAGCW